jgi:hypothetical protein
MTISIINHFEIYEKHSRGKQDMRLVVNDREELDGF